MLVVGGGPSGLAAAIEAAVAGLDVRLVEPRPFPIDKACGEGLMPAAVGSLERLGVERPYGRPFTGIRYVWNGRTAEGSFRSGPGLGVRRLELSRVLHDRVAQLGISIESERVRAVKQNDGFVEAAGIRAKWLIAADGLHSAVRRAIGIESIRKRSMRRGASWHFEVEPWSERVEIYLSEEGEAYVTPVADDLVGVAILAEHPSEFEREMAHYRLLRERLPEPVDQPKGAGPFPQWMKKRVHGRVLFVGDAAGFLDPITGEGIQLGFQAAQAAVAAIRAGDVGRYDRAWWRLTRRYWWLTSGLLAIRNTGPLNRFLVPTLHAMPGLFDAALRFLGERPSGARSPRR